MTVLGGAAILERLRNFEVFEPDTWDCTAVREASYALTLAWDGLVVDGQPYPPGRQYPESQLTIKPGRIAILSTKEILRMPGDLSGKVGVRLDFAAIGLVGLMGIQVDPYYGSQSKDERLYFRVANLSNEPIRVLPTDRVFNIELHEAVRTVPPSPNKENGWLRMQRLIRNQQDTSWTYITKVEQDLEATDQRFQPLFFFGVVLVAVTLLGVISAVMINADADAAPSWVADWGWAVLVVTFSSGGIATAILVLAEAWDRGVRAAEGTRQFWRRRRPSDTSD